MPTVSTKRILIAPLDWGLGHTTRCVPLIRHIRVLGHTAVVAGNAVQQSFIKEIFSTIDFIPLEGYNITYSKWNRLAQMGLLSQLPGIQKAINNEYKWLQQLSQRMHIDGIISDNRYGLHHPNIPSVILTHQLRVQSGLGNAIDHAVQKIHYKYLERFNAIWVPDTHGDDNLAGKLSHPADLPAGAEYIGLLSQFEEKERGGPADGTLLVLLSGPEPARSVLSGILWQQLQRYSGKMVFVEGSDAAIPPSVIPPHIAYHKRLTVGKLLPLLHSADMVICRSGYSTLMDLVALRKEAILIPTPGQTEQEYLAKRQHRQGIFYSAKQTGFNLEKALKEAQQFPFHTTGLQQSFTGYKQVIEQWLAAL